MRYRTRPVEVDARQCVVAEPVKTQKGIRFASPGEWIVQGADVPAGQFLIVSMAVFEKQFEPVPDGAEEVRQVSLAICAEAAAYPGWKDADPMKRGALVYLALKQFCLTVLDTHLPDLAPGGTPPRGNTGHEPDTGQAAEPPDPAAGPAA